MIEFSQLEQLVAIKEEGTISKAADKLYISQPGLTRSIQRLEEDLELTLFDRKKNKVVLNDNGEMAVELAKKVLKERNHMIDQLQAYDKSKHAIQFASCAPAPTWGLTYIIHNLYPDMKITSEIISDDKEMINKLKDNEYSLIILNNPMESRGYICQELFSEYLYISVPKDHKLSHYKEISFKELDGESILLLSKIGFWNQLCISHLPHSHLLYQDDALVFNEIIKTSALPNFRSNITLIKEGIEDGRMAIPIIDNEAKVIYYAIYKKESKKLFSSLKKYFDTLNWKET